MDFQEKARLNQLGQKINIMKGLQLSEDEITKSFDKEDLELVEKHFKSNIEKGKSFPIGTIHNGFKKVGEGRWQKVSESHGLTKKEHKQESLNSDNKASSLYNEKGSERYNDHLEDRDKHDKAASKLDDKEYSDEDVRGKDQSKKKDSHEITFKNPDGSEGKRTIRIGNVSEKEAIDWAKEHIKGSDFNTSKSLVIDIEKSTDSKEQRVAKILAEYKIAGKLTEEEIQKAL